jgi:hypothetical protein
MEMPPTSNSRLLNAELGVMLLLFVKSSLLARQNRGRQIPEF